MFSATNLFNKTLGPNQMSPSRTSALFDDDLTTCVQTFPTQNASSVQLKILPQRNYLFRRVFKIASHFVGSHSCSPALGTRLDLYANNTRLPCVALKETVTDSMTTCSSRYESRNEWDDAVMTLIRTPSNKQSQICEIRFAWNVNGTWIIKRSSSAETMKICDHFECKFNHIL